MKKMASPDAKTLGDWAYLGIEKHFQKTIGQEADVIKDKDPEALHQMRVGMRRLRSAIAGFTLAIDLPKAAKDKKITKIAKILGALRDLDVLKETLETKYISALPKSEQRHLETVLNRLSKQRQQALEQVKLTLAGEDYQQLKQAWQKWLERPRYKEMAALPIAEILPDLLLPLASELLLHPGWLAGVKIIAGEMNFAASDRADSIEVILATSGQELHDLRKQTKKTRYQLELFSDLYSSDYADWIESLKSVQSILGEIQDSIVLAEFIQDSLGKEMPALTQALVTARGEAWQQWRSLQQHYLQPQHRQALRQAIATPNPTR